MHQFFYSPWGKTLLGIFLLTAVSCGGGGVDAGNNGGGGGGNNEFPSVEQTIGPNGGKLELPGYATLNVPAGALPGNTKVKIKTWNAEPDPENDDSVSDLRLDGSLTSRYMIAVDIDQISPTSDNIILTFSLPVEWINRGIKASAVRIYHDQLYTSDTETLSDFVSMAVVTKIISDSSLSITLPADIFTSTGDVKEHTTADFILVASPEDQVQSNLHRSSYIVASTAVTSTTTSPFLWAPYKVESGFGARWHPIQEKWQGHKGMDIKRDNRTDGYETSRIVYPVAEGEIWRAHGANYEKNDKGKMVGFGEYIVLRHAPEGKDPYYSVYGHLLEGSNSHLPRGPYEKINPGPGGRIELGTALGMMGQTGGATGPHLHVEIRPIKKNAKGRELPYNLCDPLPITQNHIPLYEPMNGKWTLDELIENGDHDYIYRTEIEFKQNGRIATGTAKYTTPDTNQTEEFNLKIQDDPGQVWSYQTRTYHKALLGFRGGPVFRLSLENKTLNRHVNNGEVPWATYNFQP